MFVFGLIMVTLGILKTAFPRFFWTLEYGWRYKNAEPSDLALILGRAVGVLMILFGLYCLLYAIFM